MKVLTLNTWQERDAWRERWDVTLGGIKRFSPDIAGFQELFNPAWAAEIQKLTGYSEMVFSDNKCGNVLYSNYPVKTWGVATLTKSPLEEYFRYVLWAELEVRGKRLFIFNTHFSWMLEDGGTRKKQAEEILNLIQEKAPEAESLLMGDLNAPPDSPEIKDLVKQGKFRDLILEKYPHELRYTWDNQNPYVAGAYHQLPDRRIDYLLARGSGPLLKDWVSCEIVLTEPNSKGVRASDHYGVLAEFK